MIVAVRFARSANRCMNDNHMGRPVTTKRERNLAALEPVLQCIDSRVDARETNLDNARDVIKSKKRKLSEVSVQISNFIDVSLTLRFRHRFYVSLQYFVIYCFTNTNNWFDLSCRGALNRKERAFCTTAARTMLSCQRSSYWHHWARFPTRSKIR